LPIYTYKCSKCDKVTEEQRPIIKRNDTAICTSLECYGFRIKQVETPALVGFDNLGRSIK
jgi:predicted nucleic acid-binding Zn ribbon protein